MSGGPVGPAHQLAALPVERAEHGRNCRHHVDHEVSGTGDGVGYKVPSGAEAVAKEGEAAIPHQGAEEGEDPVSPAVRSASAGSYSTTSSPSPATPARRPGTAVTFERMAEPTSTQPKMFELIEVPIPPPLKWSAPARRFGANIQFSVDNRGLGDATSA